MRRVTGARSPIVSAALLAVAVIVAWMQRLRPPGIGLALVYHRLGPSTGDARTELLPAIAVRDFDRQVRLVRRLYRLVPASELRAAARRRRRGGRVPLAITFDDDEPGHLAYAAPVLERAGAPATFFLCGGSLDGPRTYWWDRLQRLADAGRLAETGLGGDIHSAARAIEAMPPGERDELDRRLASLAGSDPPDAGLRAAAVAELAGRGFEIGFHTRDHHPLDTLDDAGLERALRDGRAELEHAAGHRLAGIAYPNGRADARTPRAAAAAGFDVGFTTAGHGLFPTTDPRIIGRVEPRSPSLGLFALKLAVAHLRHPPLD